VSNPSASHWFSCRVALGNFKCVFLTRKRNRIRPGAKILPFNGWGKDFIFALACCLTMVTSGCGAGVSKPLGGSLVVSPDTVNFGGVAVDHQADSSVTVTNSGSSPIDVSQVNVSGQVFSLLGSSSMPISIPSGGNSTLKIGFTPVSTTNYSGQLNLMGISGDVIAQVPMQGQGLSQDVSQLAVSAASLRFGGVTVNTTTTQSLTLTSTGTSPVTVNSAAITGAGFTIVGGSFPVTLNPAQTLTLQVQFEPTTAGSLVGQITISSDSTSGDTAVVALTGTGAAVAHQVDLSWDAPASSPDPVAGYNIYRATGSGSFALINSSPDSALTYVDSTVVSGATYSYEVTSVDSSGQQSVASNQITVTIPSGQVLGEVREAPTDEKEPVIMVH
jgi:hypothetical protein